ncbi:PEP/pyruvate-binding domain-containing protein [Actinomycetospora lemnae]|uniref:Phosphoenolpyruvate synthase n=1 Tax=Actinomycetospora lemnae TaxID=3019891 RepID=A0ABT5SR27_9PSEU|nr:PEP/pyruvate-binding domain-containing protein [Actinomycetospora sp. DW7H6]MDD7964925.1 PEP/pyruvate-binding domain-containing protein [Actinomycetospora sp. DW7H6]
MAAETPDLMVHSCDAVVWIDEVDPQRAIAVGGSKMGRLAELLQSGVEVPQGFAVTVDAYARHCRESGLDARIDAVIGRLGSQASAPSEAQVEEASAEIRAMFRETPIGEDLTARLTEAYEELCLRCVDVNVPVAVRSSATGEDAADASFAGIFDTYLGVSGIERVLDAVRNCWGSLFTGRALAYRLRRGISHHAMPIAVGVIELIHARASGVAFSVHPVTGKSDRIVVETSWGWGEAIVQGLVDPDHVEIGKADGRVLKYDVAHKRIVSAFDFAVGAVTEIDMPAKLADRRVLDDEQVGAICAAVRAIEDHYGYPVDVEWVISRHRRAGDPVCIVQTRPVTVTAAPEEAAPTAYDPVALAQKYLFSGKPIPGR